MEDASQFEFPQTGWAPRDSDLFSFHKDAVEVLGEYSPTIGAVVINPLATGIAYSPSAIATHEIQHQFLTINTSFGHFTQYLRILVRHGLSLEILRACMRKQWFVQELAATYAELSVLAADGREPFENGVRSLPSIRLNQAPYREAFDSVQRHLPLEPGKPDTTLSAQRLLVITLAFAAMNSDCLIRMHPLPQTVAALAACMNDAPNSRLETIMNLVVSKNLLSSLVEEIVAVSKEPRHHEAGPMIFRRVCQLLPEIEVQSEQSVLDQRALVLEDLRAIGLIIELQKSGTEPLPSIRDSDNRHRRVLAANPPPKMIVGALKERLALTTERGLGLSLEFSVRGPEETLVTARSYFFKPGQAPVPSENEQDEPTEPLPQPFQGVMSISEVLREIETFTSLPHAAVFINHSRPRWNEVPGAHARVANLVQVCRQSNLSYELVRDSILGFENLGEGQGAQYVVRRAGSGRYVASFFNPQFPLLYGLQRIPSDFGLDLFLTICNRLGVPRCDKPAPAFPLENLISMISFPYMW